MLFYIISFTIASLIARTVANVSVAIDSKKANKFSALLIFKQAVCLIFDKDDIAKIILPLCGVPQGYVFRCTSQIREKTARYLLRRSKETIKCVV